MSGTDRIHACSLPANFTKRTGVRINRLWDLATSEGTLPKAGCPDFMKSLLWSQLMERSTELQYYILLPTDAAPTLFKDPEGPLTFVSPTDPNLLTWKTAADKGVVLVVTGTFPVPL